MKPDFTMSHAILKALVHTDKAPPKTAKRQANERTRSSINCFINHAVDDRPVNVGGTRNDLLNAIKLTIWLFRSRASFPCWYFSHVSTTRLRNGSLIAFTCGWLEGLKNSSILMQEFLFRKNQNLRFFQRVLLFFFVCAKKNSFEAAHRAHLFL